MRLFYRIIYLRKLRKIYVGEEMRKCQQIERYISGRKYGEIIREYSWAKNVGARGLERSRTGGIHLVCSHEFAAVPRASLLPSRTLHM